MRLFVFRTSAALALAAFGVAQTPPPPAAAPAKPRPSPTAAAKPVPKVNPKLRNPALNNETAPENYKAKFVTTKGDFVISVTRASAPRGADRFYNLVKNGYFTDIYFFRVVPGFIVQFGIHSDPQISAAWRNANLQDDPVRETNKRGTITFATAGPNTRTTQLFINFGDNNRLDGMGFAAFGYVSEGMDTVDKINAEYGETPDQNQIQQQGGAFLARAYPRMDKILSATITDPPPAPPKPAAPKPAATPAAKPAATPAAKPPATPAAKPSTPPAK